MFESSFWISVSGSKLTILPDIQPANRIVIISEILYKNPPNFPPKNPPPTKRKFHRSTKSKNSQIWRKNSTYGNIVDGVYVKGIRDDQYTLSGLPVEYPAG